MREPAPWQKRYGRMLLLACLLGLCSQYLFVGKAAGVSVMLFLGGYYFLFLYSVRGRLGGFDRWQGQSTAGWLLLIPITLLAMTYVLYANVLYRVLNGLALPILVVAQTMLVTRNGSHAWYKIAFVQEMLVQSIFRPLSHIPVPFGMLRSLIPGTDSKGEDSGFGRLRKIMLGLLLAAPILLIVISLLASADRIFQSWLEEIPQWMDGISIGSWVYRVIVMIVIALYTFCYIWGLLFPQAMETSELSAAAEFVDEGGQLKQERKRQSLDPLIAGTLLVSVNLVYMLFAAIQFSYLFGAANGLLPEGAAYAEYARKGFAELVLVAILNLGLLLPGLHYIRKSSKVAEMVRKLLLSMLVGCTVVMLISSYSRLSLYEEAYGFTQTRLLVHGFMLFLGIWLILALIRVWQERFSLSKAYVCSALIAYVVMNYANLDYRIAVNNIARYERTGILDVAYLNKLSTDAAPALQRFQAKHSDMLQLQSILDKMKRESAQDNSWPSWNVSKLRMK